MELRESTFIIITFISKIGGVAFFAVGTERLVAGEPILSIILMALGMGLFFIPFKICVNNGEDGSCSDRRMSMK